MRTCATLTQTGWRVGGLLPRRPVLWDPSDACSTALRSAAVACSGLQRPLLPAPHPPPPQHINRRRHCCSCRHFALQHSEIPELQRKVASLETEQEVRGGAAASLLLFFLQALVVAERGIKLMHVICATPACLLLHLLVLSLLCAGTEAETGRLCEQPGCGRR